MKPGLRHQLAQLDRSLLALANERARLLSEVEPHDPQRLAAVDDLLRRHAGPMPADAVQALFDVLDRGCREGNQP